jgi:hypothetical protein
VNDDVKQHADASLGHLAERLQATKDELLRILDEREKAAKAQHESLARSIDDAARSLHDFITTQVTMLQLSEKVRGDALDARIAAIQREAEIVRECTEAAAEKAADQVEKRFAAASEWHEHSIERERRLQEQVAELSNTFLPREVAEAQFIELRRIVQDLSEKIGKVI